MKRTYLVLIIAMLLIGFASIATNLAINGMINFGFNINNFNSNVIFTYKDTYNGNASISADGKNITFNSIKLENIDQQAILRYDIANKSNQYDAEVLVNCVFEEDSAKYDEWLDIKNDLASSFTLDAGKTQTGNLTVTLTKAYNEGLEDTVNIKCTITASPTSRNDKQEYVPVEHNYEEVLLQGADPVLDVPSVVALDVETPKKLVPVIIDENGDVTKADITEKWYDYENRQWANAVILADGVDEPEPKEVIPEENIESYFVWIPKYRYKLFNIEDYTGLESENSVLADKSRIIEIEFGLENTTDIDNYSCATPLNDEGTQALSGNIGECSNGEWMTHPAFITMGVSGFWVGKFETGYKQDGEISNWTKTQAESNEVDVDKIIIKPNVYSWRKINFLNAFNNSLQYRRNLDSHMMKNTEWGAVAYLSNSIYGRCKNGEICSEVRINNNYNFITGYAAKDQTIKGYGEYKDYETTKLSEDGEKTNNYLNQDSQLASTTGNYTGIYDMSGDSWEYVMGIMLNQNETVGDAYKSIDPKYYDAYKYGEKEDDFSRKILGDATGEMGPFVKADYANNRIISSWYKDDAHFVMTNLILFARGGSREYGTNAGLFAFPHVGGGEQEHYSYRIVLSPQ